mmetsp:Transcript_4841/g.20746  ORF Transcript_4841/g.20746 Transcript_4841/m.20746 type:complete len:247 (+) Transcript_4841:918-1658(+)
MRPRLEVRVFASISTLGAGRASLRPMARLCSSGGFTRWPCDTGASTSATVSWEELSSAVAASGSGSLSAAAAAAAARDAGAVPPAAPDSSSGEACLTARLEAAKSLDATAFGSLPRILRTTRRSSTGASPMRFRAQRSAASNTCISGLRLARGSSVSSSREMSAANSSGSRSSTSHDARVVVPSLHMARRCALAPSRSPSAAACANAWTVDMASVPESREVAASCSRASAPRACATCCSCRRSLRA